MRSVLLKKFGSSKEAFVIRKMEFPKPGSHQVRIDVEAFGLNFADVLARKGLYPDVPPRPCVLGYEVVGHIDEIGAEVPQKYLGKRVLALTRFGGYSTLAITDYRALAELPDDYPAEKAMALGTQGTTAWTCFNERTQLRAGDRVLIHAGAGGVGNILCQLALNRGCIVYATAGSEEKLDFLRKLGVQHPINYRDRDYYRAAKNLLGTYRLDATFNSIAGKTLRKDFRLLGAGGTLVLYGAASRVGKRSGMWSGLQLLFGTGFFSPLSLIMGSKSIVGVNILKIGDRKPERIAEALKNIVAAAQSDEIVPTVGGVYSIGELNEAHSLLEGRSTIGKLSVFWNTKPDET